MRNVIRCVTVFTVCILRLVSASAEEPDAACKATPENAKYQLEKASGHAVQALNDWLHYCPNEDQMAKYAEEIQKAKADSNKKTPPAAATPAPIDNSMPKPRAAKPIAEPVGTFVRTLRLTNKNGSGDQDWTETLVIRADGTAEMTAKVDVTLDDDWHLQGCAVGVTQGVEVFKQAFNVSVSGPTVILEPQGRRERTHVEPLCFEARKENEDPGDPAILNWINGRLIFMDGEYTQQD